MEDRVVRSSWWDQGRLLGEVTPGACLWAGLSISPSGRADRYHRHGRHWWKGPELGEGGA